MMSGSRPKNERPEEGADESGAGRHQPRFSGGFAVGEGVSGTQKAVERVLDPESEQEVVDRIKKGAVVWVVDDEPMIRDVMEKTMRRNGFKGRSMFASPQEVLDKIYEKGKDGTPGKILMIPDMILTDTNMLGMMGSEMIARLEEIFDRHDIPREKRPVYLAMSGLSMDSRNTGAMQYYESHGIRFIKKPFDSNKILPEMIEYLKPRFTKKSEGVERSEK